MSALTVIEIVKGIKDLKTHLDNISKYSKAAEKAAGGNDSFPPPKKVQTALKKLTALEKQFKNLAKSGVDAPLQAKVSLADLADPKTKDQAVKLLLWNLKMRDAVVEDAKRLCKKLRTVSKDAKVRAKVAYAISKDMANLVKAPLPDIGTMGKTNYFEFHLLFQKASGTLNRVATAANNALARMKKDIARIQAETQTARTTLKTFGIQ